MNLEDYQRFFYLVLIRKCLLPEIFGFSRNLLNFDFLFSSFEIFPKFSKFGFLFSSFEIFKKICVLNILDFQGYARIRNFAFFISKFFDIFGAFVVYTRNGVLSSQPPKNHFRILFLYFSDSGLNLCFYFNH